MLKQGEKLLVLVKRDDRDAATIANAMGYDKSYLPKLYKMDILPRKPRERAIALFGLPENYFDQSDTSFVSEPDALYRAVSDNNLLEKLRAENKALKETLRSLKDQLEQERRLSANLAEALKNLSHK